MASVSLRENQEGEENQLAGSAITYQCARAEQIKRCRSVIQIEAVSFLE